MKKHVQIFNFFFIQDQDRNNNDEDVETLNDEQKSIKSEKISREWTEIE